MRPETIRVIVLKDDALWVAQCLEYDIGAQASDPELLRERLESVLEAEFAESMSRYGKPFGGIESAPPYFFDLWEKRSRESEQTRNSNIGGEPLHLEMAHAA